MARRTGTTGRMDRGRRPGPLRRRRCSPSSGVGGLVGGLPSWKRPRSAWRRADPPPPGAVGERRGDGGTARIASSRPWSWCTGPGSSPPGCLGSLGCPVVNVHAGITPRYRGVHGGYWALAERHPEWVGTTVHLVDPGIDTGAILAQATFDVSRRGHDRHLPGPAPDPRARCCSAPRWTR